jgi:hypothetical protein
VTKTSLPMADVFLSYGKLICLGGLSGGFACLPTISVAGTLYKIGAVGGKDWICFSVFGCPRHTKPK